MQVAKIMAGAAVHDPGMPASYIGFDFRLRLSPTGTRIISLEGNSSPGALLSAEAAVHLGNGRLLRCSIELMHGGGKWLRDRKAVYGYCLGGFLAARRAERLFERP